MNWAEAMPTGKGSQGKFGREAVVVGGEKERQKERDRFGLICLNGKAGWIARRRRMSEEDRRSREKRDARESDWVRVSAWERVRVCVREKREEKKRGWIGLDWIGLDWAWTIRECVEMMEGREKGKREGK
jgi:hypothetical protein